MNEIVGTIDDGNTLQGTVNYQDGGTGGTSNYLDLLNKPSINNVELQGNKTLEELGIQPRGNYATNEQAEEILKSAKDYTDNSIARDFKDISYDSDTATFVFTRHDNTTFTIDLPIEQTVKNGYYDETTKELVLVLISDQEIRIPATGLIDDYIGVDSATIQCTISADNKITCNIIAGSITKTLLTTELQAEIDNKVNKSSFVYDETTETLNITI